MTLSIDRMFAYIAADEEGEGIAAHLTSMGWMPLVGADEERMKQLKPIAQQAATAGGKRIVLVQFEQRTDLEILEPDPAGLDGGVVIIDPGTGKTASKTTTSEED